MRFGTEFRTGFGTVFRIGKRNCGPCLLSAIAVSTAARSDVRASVCGCVVRAAGGGKRLVSAKISRRVAKNFLFPASADRVAGVVRFSARRAPEQKRVNASHLDDPITDLFKAG
jgi:hypothetical protein